MSDDLFKFLIILLIFILVAVIAYYFNNKNVILRSLRKIPLKRVSGFKTNELVKVHGKALHVKEPLIAPYSKRKCIFYSIKIEKKVSSGKQTYWKTIKEDEKFQDFFVDNNGDYVIVKPNNYPKNYISYLVIDKKQRSGIFNGPTPEFLDVLNYYNVSSENFLGLNKSLRYSEGIIEIGEEITVAGIAKWKTITVPIPEYPYSKIASLESSDKQKLIITDLPEAYLPNVRKQKLGRYRKIKN